MIKFQHLIDLLKGNYKNTLNKHSNDLGFHDEMFAELGDNVRKIKTATMDLTARLQILEEEFKKKFGNF